MSRLFLEFLKRSEALAPFYPNNLKLDAWKGERRALPLQVRIEVASLVEQQNRSYGAGERTFGNIGKLREGAAAVVTGQQVGLFGGPLYALLKAASAIRLAENATAAGNPTVPVFWMATEDHDYAEVDHVVIPERHALHTVRLHHEGTGQRPVGALPLGLQIEPVMQQTRTILGDNAFTEQLRHWYRPDNSFAQAFAEMMAAVFAPWGLIVMDAAGRAYHQLGSEVFRRAIVNTDALHTALVERDRELQAGGYHAQVLVPEGSSLLFLLDAKTGARVPLRRAEGKWKAGGRQFSTEDLLRIVDAEPERLSPNALLRPVFQDTLLPTLAYIGGPAEIAYFAQSEVLYQRLLGRAATVVPRLSVTLVEPAIRTILERHELSLKDAFTRAEDLAARLGARAIPIEGKRNLSATGQALDRELSETTAWMATLDQGLGRAATTAASKMRYQMNRLRRLAANYQLQKETSLQRHASAVVDALYPNGHLQERVIGGAYFLTRYGDLLPEWLVEAAGAECGEHQILFL